MSLIITGTFAAIALVFLLLFRRSLGRKSLKNLCGPPAPSKLFGNEYELSREVDVGTLEFQWMREYGPTWRTRGFFGVEQIMTADPKALQHILQKSGYNYRKRVDQNHMLYLILGPGIIWAEGEMHQRQRKVMNPAFTAQQLKSFIPLFQHTGRKVATKWKDLIINGTSKDGTIIMVNKWLARGALDVIGEAAFDYGFGALDNKETALAKEYSTIFTDSSLFTSKTEMLFRAVWPYLPQPVLMFIRYLPTRLYARFRSVNKMFANIGQPLLQSSVEGGTPGPAQEQRKDVLSILAKANADETARIRLGNEEVLAQMHHLTAAGHETTANTLSWMLYELSKLPEYQSRVRDEIRAARAVVIARGETDFTLDDLDNMKCTLAAIKETLRFHPIVFRIGRYSTKDDVIPLSEPVVGKNGEVISEIPVRAGQDVTLSLCGYNRVWGEDADKWNPDRFLTNDNDNEKRVKVGVYANLMSFSAGIRACIGWRFALNQLQAVSAEVLENFVFSIPEGQPRILRGPSGVMVPLVEGKENLGSAMPLRVSLVE